MHAPLSWMIGRDARPENASLHIEVTLLRNTGVSPYSSREGSLKAYTFLSNCTALTADCGETWKDVVWPASESEAIPRALSYSKHLIFMLYRIHSLSQLIPHLYVHFLLTILIISLWSWLTSSTGNFIKVVSELPARRGSSVVCPCLYL